GRLVDGARCDVAVDPHGVEAGFGRELDVTADLGVARRTDRRARREQVGTLEEEPLAVHGARPVVPCDLAETRSAYSTVAHGTVDEDVDRDVGQRLIAERTWPPEHRVGDVDGPVDLVHAGSNPVLVLVDRLAIDARADQDA